MAKDNFGLDPKEVKRTEEEEAEFQRNLKRRTDDIKKLLKSPEFRRFIWSILSETGIFRASFTNNSMNTAFLEGKRDVGLWLIKDIDEADTNALFQIRQEYISELKSKEAVIKKQEEANNGD